jgi:glutathione S-transferase
MFTLVLYQFQTSPLCAKVRKILDFKGLDYRTIEVDYVDRTELPNASGQTLVPALTLDSGETVADSDRIAEVLEDRFPEPAIFPPTWRGVHLALARYFDTELGDTLMRAALPDLLEHYARIGAAHVAAFRLNLERKYGEGFCDATVQEHRASMERARALLAPLDETLVDRAFLMGRIGYADFALYGALNYLTFTGDLKIPAAIENLAAYYGRIDRIRATLDPND